MSDLIKHKNEVFRLNILKRVDDLIRNEIFEEETAGKLKLGDGFNLASYLDEHEKNIIHFALNMANYNQIVAARLLGVKHTTLNFKVKKFKLLEHTDKKPLPEISLSSLDEAA